MTTVINILKCQSVTHFGCSICVINEMLLFIYPFFPSQTFTKESLAKACAKSDSVKHFVRAIKAIKKSNRNTDFLYSSEDELHFDNEKILAGRERIKRDLVAVKASVKQENFVTARKILGQLTHSLQVIFMFCCLWKML